MVGQFFGKKTWLLLCLVLPACGDPGSIAWSSGKHQVFPHASHVLRLQPKAPSACFAYLDCTYGREDEDHDARLRLVDSRGRILAADDDSGPLLSPVIAGAWVPAGECCRLVWENSGEPAFPCRLYACLLPASAIIPEQEPNDSCQEASPLAFNCGAAGTLPPGDEDWHWFRARAGQVVAAFCSQSPGIPGSAARTDLRLLDQGSRVLALGDNTQAAANAVGSIAISRSGVYYLRVANPTSTSVSYCLVPACDPAE